jgi:hypothetical protein
MGSRWGDREGWFSKIGLPIGVIENLPMKSVRLLTQNDGLELFTAI